MNDTDQPVGEIPDTAALQHIITKIDAVRDAGLEAIRKLTTINEELRRENVALAAKLETARWERDTAPHVHNHRRGW